MSWTRLYLFIALPFALAMVVLVPLGEAPDEAAHVGRAASLLRGQLIAQRGIAAHPVDGKPIAVAALPIDPSYRLPLFRLPSLPLEARKPIGWAQLKQTYGVGWTGTVEMFDASNTGNYIPVFYLPAALGLASGTVAGLSPAGTVFAARLANALGCILLGALALRHAGRLRPFLFALLLLPMTVHLQASVNQDGPLIAAAALAASLLAHADSGRRFWSGTALLAAVAAAKPAYLPLAVAALVPLGAGPWRLRRHGAGFAVIVGAALAWAALAAAVSVVPFWRGPYRPGPLWPGDPATLFSIADPKAQLQVLLADPTRVLTLPWDTITEHADFLASSTVGCLAWLDLALPGPFITAWYIALACAALACLPGRAPRHPAGRLLVLLGGLASVLAVFILQYLSWTNVGATQVDGVQGRYLIPILAVLALALPSLPCGAVAARYWRALLAVPVVAMAWVTLAVTPSAVALRYYVP